MSTPYLASAVEAFGRRGEPVGLSITLVVVSGAAIVFGVTTAIVRKARGLPPVPARRRNPKSKDSQ